MGSKRSASWASLDDGEPHQETVVNLLLEMQQEIKKLKEDKTTSDSKDPAQERKEPEKAKHILQQEALDLDFQKLDPSMQPLAKWLREQLRADRRSDIWTTIPHVMRSGHTAGYNSRRGRGRWPR